MKQTRNKSIAVIAALAAAALTLTLAPSLAVGKNKQACNVKRAPSKSNSLCVKVRVVDSKSKSASLRACNHFGVQADGSIVQTKMLCPGENRLNAAKASHIDVRVNQPLLDLATWSGVEILHGIPLDSSGKLWRLAIPLLSAKVDFFSVYGFTTANGGREFQIPYEVKFNRRK